MKVSPELYNVQVEGSTVWYDNDDDQCIKLDKYHKEVNKFNMISFLQIEEFQPDRKYYNVIKQELLVLSKDQIMELVINNIRFTVKQQINVEVDITQQIVDLAEKPVKIAMSEGRGNTYNNKCEVHLPGNMLAMYNEMLLLEDCCTDELQNSLNSGWRIVAVCPQPDQRRPDYILGRFNPDFDGDCSAKRRG